MSPFAAFIDAQLFVSAHVNIIIVHVILLTVAYLILLERKASAYIQDRLGPNRAGPWGLLQPIADGLKFLLKEDYMPTGADKVLFTLAPCAIIIPALIAWAVIPWGGYWMAPDIPTPFGTIEGAKVLVSAADVNIGVVYLLAVTSLGVYGITLGGWASNNKYSFLGGLRATAGMISYEIPLGIALLIVLLTAGTVSPQRLIEAQIDGGWYVLAHPLAAILFFVAIMAEANRAPFDNAEAEQELVGGYHTEYSSMRFAMFFLAEYAAIITSSAFLAVLFFGGYHLPFVELTSPAATSLLAVVVKFLVLFTKILIAIFVMMVIRWTIPRVRWDQVMKLAWNALIPLGIVLVVTTAFMVHFGATAWWELLLMNVGVGVGIVAIQPLLPKSPNRAIPLAGSRYRPPEGERVVTAATGAAASAGGPAVEGHGGAKRETITAAS